MRVPIVEYIVLALSSGIGHSAPGPQFVHVATLGAPSSTPSCWASSSGVSANYGPLNDLRIDATWFCNAFSTNSTAAVVSSQAGQFIFGWQSAMYVGNFASWTSCFNTFNTLVTACYGTASPTRPVALGGTIVDPGGANLVISFGDGAQL